MSSTMAHDYSDSGFCRHCGAGRTQRPCPGEEQAVDAPAPMARNRRGALILIAVSLAVVLSIAWTFARVAAGSSPQVDEDVAATVEVLAGAVEELRALEPGGKQAVRDRLVTLTSQ